jgi:hypothetical protein
MGFLTLEISSGGRNAGCFGIFWNGFKLEAMEALGVRPVRDYCVGVDVGFLIGRETVKLKERLK